nr:MAG TPA: hypothetical protein [Caudoviricetes sp.]
MFVSFLRLIKVYPYHYISSRHFFSLLKHFKLFKFICCKYDTLILYLSQRRRSYD